MTYRLLLPSVLALLALSRCTPAARGGPPSGPRSAPSFPPATPKELFSKAVGEQTDGFRIDAYYKDAQRRRGARLVDPASGLTVDLITIETVPEARLCVSTPPTSDRGEPHTQEHLLISKGRKGRSYAGQLSLWHVSHQAATHPQDTCYGVAATGGTPTFLPALATLFDAVLHPDYTDEEVLREVYHFDVARGDGGHRDLVELGAVYNEMVRSSAMPGERAWQALRGVLYGSGHPVAYDAGGAPTRIGELTPEGIARFHDAYYRLGRMRLVVSVPPSMPVASVLHTLRGVVARESATVDAGAPSPAIPPSPRRETASAGTVRVVPFPAADATSPGTVVIAYPPSDELSVAQRFATEIVLAELADGASSRLAKRLEALRDSPKGFGAPKLDAEVLELPGRPASIWMSNVPPAALAEARLAELRDLVQGELATLAAQTAPQEIDELRQRLLSRVTEKRRSLLDALESPPNLDARGGDLGWNFKLDEALQSPGSEKSLLFEGPLAEVEARIRATGNPLARLTAGLAIGNVAPFVVAAAPSVDLRKSLDDAAAERKRVELQRLVKKLGAPSTDAALTKLEEERAAATRVLSEIVAHDPPPPAPPSLPMTLDEGVTYVERRVGAIPVIDVPFETMSAATVGVAIPLDRVPGDLLPYLPLLPDLLREAGVREGERVVAHDEVEARLRRETRRVGVSFGGASYGVPELRLTASGFGVEETRSALRWLMRLIESADWDGRNLDRLRGLAEGAEERFLGKPAGPEEYWVPALREALVYRNDPALFHIGSSFTQAHDAHRLGWMLSAKIGSAPDASGASPLRALQGALRPLSRAQAIKLAGALADGELRDAPKVAAAVRASRDADVALAAVRRAGRGLARRMGELPESSFRADVQSYLDEAAAALAAGPQRALESIRRLRDLLVHRSPARAWVVTSPAQHAALRSEIDAVLGRFADNVEPPAARSPASSLDARVRARGASTEGHPLGLVLPSMSSATIATSIPAPTFADASDGAVLDALATLLFSGGGPTSLWSKTAAAGLAYSNGANIWLASGRGQYYAERCPDARATLAFVADVVTTSTDLSPMLGPATARTFYSRSSDSLDDRASAIANDVSRGLTPEKIRAFHEKVLAFAQRSDLANELAARKLARYGELVPGLDPTRNGAEHGLQLVIGPDPLVTGVDAYLKERTSNRVSVTRIYPRDFWDDGRAIAKGR